MKYPSNKFSWKGTIITNYWIKSSDIESYTPITQVYGIIVNENSEILICRERKKDGWQLPGGKPEKGEGLKTALKREVIEEVDVELMEIKPLGVVKVEYPNNPNTEEGDVFYQTRFVAKVRKINNQTPDPASKLTWKRKFVKIKNINKYIDWGTVGEVMFNDAFEVIENKNKLPYRRGVTGIVIDSNNKILLVQMIDYGDNHWRFPGGGVDERENEKDALLRELEEELQTKSFEIVKKSKHINKFEWPEEVIEKQYKIKGIKWRGQQQSQYLVLFTGDKSDIKPNPKEIKRVKWVSIGQLKEHLVFEGQWEQAELAFKDLEVIK